LPKISWWEFGDEQSEELTSQQHDDLINKIAIGIRATEHFGGIMTMLVFCYLCSIGLNPTLACRLKLVYYIFT